MTIISIDALTATNKVDVTVGEMAKAFWNMSSEQQAQFFDSLGEVIEQDHKTNPCAYSYGELQWCSLKEEFKKEGMGRANKVHMALSAFAYEFVEQKPDGCGT